MSEVGSPVSIKYLDRETIGKISAGKVIPSLAMVVKELIENALDADATYIQLRFIDYGKDLIEVSDDGSGIQEEDFPNLALPHFTSKLKHYRDLCAIKSFGFRGEALASIAELSELKIITRHGSREAGSELAFNNNGELISVQPIARPIGTTVRIKNLFHTYPVRRKEFEANYIKQFNNMMQFIYPYALGFTDLRLMVNNTINGRKNEILNIEPKSIKDNIIQLLGCKQMKTIQPFVQHPIKQEVAEEYKLPESYTQEENEIRISGYVSHGDKGPSKLKKVYFYMNRRPAHYEPLEKLILSVYKEINQTINPFVLLHVDLGKHEIDFSVTPDKRTFSLPKENLLFAILKSSLLKMFETNTVALDSTKPSSYHSYQSSQKSGQPSTPKKRPIEEDSDGTISDLDDDVRSLNRYRHTTLLRCSSPADSYMRLSPVSENPTAPTTPMALMTPVRAANTSLDFHTQNLGHLRPEDLTSGDENEIPNDTGVYNPVRNILREAEAEAESGGTERQSNKKGKSREGLTLSTSKEPTPKYPSELNGGESHSSKTMLKGLRSLSQFSFNGKRRKKSDESTNQRSVRDIFTVMPRQRSTDDLTNGSDNPNDTSNNSTLSDLSMHIDLQSTMLMPAETNQTVLPPIPSCSQIPHETICVPITISGRSSTSPEAPNIDEPIQKSTETESSSRPNEPTRKGKKVISDVPAIGVVKQRINFNSTFTDEQLSTRYSKLHDSVIRKSSRFFTKLNKCSDQSLAEDELKREMQKEAFGVMEIIGQFNKAFIITKLDDDVFIIDQHASDERYNFEDLLENTVLDTQRLVNPIPLLLTCYQESIVASNLPTFERLSFKIEIHPERPSGSRAVLVQVPISQNYLFGKTEIEEILSQMEETGSDCSNYRPEKMIRMIASRACRKSIMINDSLDHRRMRNVLNNLIKLKNPWICAHGRPTIRFLFNINEIKSAT